MPKFYFEKTVNEERGKVFTLFTDYEQIQKTLPMHFPSVTIRSTRGNTAVIEEHVRMADFEFVMMTKHFTKFPETHEISVIGGDSKGTQIVERYESVPEGTKISVNVVLKFGLLKISLYFKTKKIEKSLIQIYEDLASMIK